MKTSFFTLLIAVASLSTKADNTWWSASWNAKGTYIAVGGDAGTLLILNARDLSLYRQFKFDSSTIAAVSWHPTEDIIALAGYSHSQRTGRNLAHLVDINSGRIQKLGEPSFGGRGLAWNPNGQQVAVAGESEIRIFSARGKEMNRIQHPSNRSLFALAWHPTENKIAVSEEDIRVYDTNNGREILKITTSEQPKGVMCLAWHPSGKILASGDYGHQNEGGEPTYLKFWDDAGKLIKVMKGSQSVYRGLKWNKNGTQLISASDSLRMWDNDGKLLHSANAGKFDLWGVDWNTSNDRFFTSGSDGVLLLWSSSGVLLVKKLLP